MSKVAVLFCEKSSVYKTIDDCDVYDRERDARTYCGNLPVIAHPPCRKFSVMRAFSTAPESEKELAYFGVKMVRKNGGVLEHPAKSLLWQEMKLPLSGFDEFGGYSIEVSQFDFGHQAQKLTWLYIVGYPHDIVIKKRLELPVKIIGTGRNNKGNDIPKKDRNKTPIRFADFLIEIAKNCKAPEVFN